MKNKKLTIQKEINQISEKMILLQKKVDELYFSDNIIEIEKYQNEIFQLDQIHNDKSIELSKLNQT
jgi:hypothetical protein